MNIVKRIFLVTLLAFALNACTTAQVSPFQISLEPLNIKGLEGIQTCVIGQHEGKWLIMGGRLDGLHRRQPWATFDVEGQNRLIIVVDPVAGERWSLPLTSLPVPIQEQLSSTNMEFFQEGDNLYVIGGYGYSNTAEDHITYPYLTAIKVSGVISAVINKTSFNDFFRQIADDRFAVTGGYLNKIYNTYYLTGGQRFDGRYNPMGHGTYIQEYTNAIRKFNISDDGNILNITHLSSVTDTANLHRRDFNVIPQIMPDGQEGLTAFSGVFQVKADLPFLNSVNIDSSGYTVNNSFIQYYNHYHCAHIPLYSKASNEMHNVFFGGIAQYTDSAGILVRNDNVPFVKTIAMVTRDRNGIMTEYKLPVEMPAFLGAGSEFIHVDNLPEYDNEVIDLDEIQEGTLLIGYIFGGINSTESEIFWSNNGTQSIANPEIFKVYLSKKGR